MDYVGPETGHDVIVFVVEEFWRTVQILRLV